MTAPGKIKGNNYEREIVEQAKSMGLEAKRAYASNGMSLGLTEDVDVVVEGIPLQCKRRKKLGAIVRPNSNAYQCIREDRGETFIVLPIVDFLQFVLSEKQLNNLRGAL